MVSEDTISKRGMCVWIWSHVPSAIALSLFILKSSNLYKINNASYPNLSCGNDSDYWLLTIWNLLLSPAQLQSGQKYLVPFFKWYHVHYSFPTCCPWLPIFNTSSSCQVSQSLRIYTGVLLILFLPSPEFWTRFLFSYKF